MNAVLDAVLPVFGLILAGYLCGRPFSRDTLIGRLRAGPAGRDAPALLGPTVTDGLNRFVVLLALPALLFLAMTRINREQLAHGGYVLALMLGMLVTFGLAWWLHRRQHGPDSARTDVAIESLAAGYANTGFMGFPLSLAVFGQDGQPAVVVATVATACVLFGIVIAIIEFDRQASQHQPSRVALQVARTLARNPLLVAPLLGCVVAASGITLPSVVVRFIALLGAAASPCALVTIGLFLAQQTVSADRLSVTRLVVLKLLFQPLLTAVLVTWVFEMPTLWAHSAILLSALPIGTGPFMLAQNYGRQAAVSSRAILVSTVLSVLTISALIAYWA